MIMIIVMDKMIMIIRIHHIDDDDSIIHHVIPILQYLTKGLC